MSWSTICGASSSGASRKRSSTARGEGCTSSPAGADGDGAGDLSSHCPKEAGRASFTAPTLRARFPVEELPPSGADTPGLGRFWMIT